MAEPKVRFKRDDGSSYPEWITGRLGDITDKVDRKAPVGSVAPIMMVSQGNGFIYQADKYSRENAGQSLKNYTLLRQGEFAYNHGASKAKPYGVAYCLKEEHEARVPFVYHTFRITKGINSYWHEALNTSRMDRKLKRMVSSGVRMDGLLNINYDTYMDVDVCIPCEEEQRKIADFLSSIDEVIAASEQEVANLEKQKKAVMKKIFSQEVRFKKEDGSYFPKWEVKPLNYYLSENKERNKDRRYTKVDVLSVSKDYGAVNQIKYFGKSLAGEDLSNYHCVYAGDVIYTKSPLGKQPYGIIKASKNNGIVSTLYAVYHCNERVLPELVDYYFSNDVVLNNYLKPLVNIGAKHDMKVHNDVAISGFVCFPSSIEEQRLIIDFLSDFDEAIAAAKKELELWKELKKGLLQQMFV